MQISLKPVGGKGAVNPADVTSVMPEADSGGSGTTMWVRGHSGYGTYSVDLTGRPDHVRKYLNDPVAFLRKRYIASLKAVRDSISDAVKPEPPKDWQDSLLDASDCLQGVINSMQDEGV